MATPVETRPEARPTNPVAPEMPKAGQTSSAVAERPSVVGKGPVESVVLPKSAVETPVGGIKAAVPAATEVKPTPAPGK